MPEQETIELQINGKKATAPKNVSVLRAAEINGFYIPTLCYHKDLTPFGGCRMCIVEIEGIRGYPLACSTIATEGMKILTDSVAIQEIRKEILGLILSEHPSSCLICDEAVECRKSMKTVRKAGISTGCRYCPNDDQCELQDVFDKIGFHDINYPVLYRGIEAERMDPFFDRDYNICILCGRCVRTCQELRGTGVLAFNWRGPKAIVGTAFGRNHIEAGCEFCGDCISVCPTGALSEKVSKWDGIPDGSIISTCPYCAIGCQLEMFHKDGRFSKAVPVLDPEVNDGKACLKGRFCLAEVSHHFERARKPMKWSNGFWMEITWDEAIDMVTEKLKATKPNEFAMLISPDCTNESLYTAQKFTRLAMKTNSIDSLARPELGGGLKFWSNLFHKSITIQDIKNSKKLLVIGLDTRFNFSIVGVEIRKALQMGATLISINSRESNIAKYANLWLRPKSSFEGKILRGLVNAIRGKKKELSGLDKFLTEGSPKIQEAADLLGDLNNLTVMFGPRLFKYSNVSELTSAIDELLLNETISVVPLYYGTNTRGAMDLGTFHDILPGPYYVKDEKGRKKVETFLDAKLPSDEGISIEQITRKEKKPKVLYLVGATPFFERPDCDFIIAQDIFEPDFKVDLFLPATSFLESSGTYVNMEGRTQETRQIEKLPDSVMYGRARPDWWIFSQIAKKMNVKGFEYTNYGEILNEISQIADGFPKPGMITRFKDRFTPLQGIEESLPALKEILSDSKFLLVMQPAGYTYRGVDIRPKVEGLEILGPEDGFFMNTRDAKSIGLSAGDRIVVKTNSVSGTGVLRTGDDLPRGVVYLYIPQSFGGLSHYKDFEKLYKVDVNPCPVEVSKHDV